MGGLGSILVYFGIGHISSYNRFAGFAMASAVALLCALVVGSYVKKFLACRLWSIAAVGGMRFKRS